MPSLQPFHGIRYSSSGALAELVCPPYDIISEEEQQLLHERHPHNAVHLELSRSAHYDSVAELFSHWLDSGVLKRDEQPSLYIYRQDFIDDRNERCSVTGVIGALELEPFGEGSGILPHERTMPGPISDRLALLRAVPVNISPIYAIYRGGGALSSYHEDLKHRPTAARFVDDYGTLHRLWVVTRPAEIELLCGTVASGPLVIADGHHRYETALAYAAERAGEPGGHDAIMCFCVDADSEDLTVLPYHRAVDAHVGAEVARARLLELFGAKDVDVEYADVELRKSQADHPFLFVFDGFDLLVEVSDAEVVARLGERPRAWRALDVVALHEVVLPETFPEGVRQLHFSKDARAILRLVKSEGWTAGVLMRPLSPVQVVEVARSGERMPQKASYFWPKAVTGLVFRSLTEP
jgi:uncharacterized protein (DUF1015 family)